MRTHSKSHLSALVLLILGFVVSACATRTYEPTVSAADIPRLQQELAADPDDLDIKVRLGIAYFQGDDFEQSRTVLREAVDEGATDLAHLFLGLANEEMEEWVAARDAYAAYLELGEEGDFREEIQGRHRLMVRRTLQAQAQEALAREEELSDTPPEPRTAAVFPFTLFSSNEQLEPLGVALADMMTTDLALSGGIRVLDRAQIQMLLNEMALTEAGYTDPGTGARAGRLLRAEHVVQGALTTPTGDSLRMDTDVLFTPQAASLGDLAEEDRLEAIFDMEKEIVLGVIDLLGVEITPAEREAINNNRAANLLAFLAYGRGLMAMDEGNFAEAVEFFAAALEADPDFGPAAEALGEAEELADATGTSTEEMGQLAAAGTEGDPTAGGQTDIGDLLGSTADGVNSSGADGTIGSSSTESSGEDTPPPGEATGGADDSAAGRDDAVQGDSDGLASVTSTIIIVIDKPGSTGGGGDL